MPEIEHPLPAPPGTSDNAATVEGRTTAPPSGGFGQLWRKELSATLDGVSAVALMESWRRNLHELWPAAGEVHQRHRSIQEGELLGIDLSVGHGKLSTGVVVIESGPTALTLLAPEGHMFAGWTRFHTEDAAGGACARITIEMRASDPLYEVGLMFGGHGKEERFWAELLRNLASRHGQQATVRLTRRRQSPRRQWSRAGNIRHNAFLRTTIRRMGRGIRGGAW